MTTGPDGVAGLDEASQQSTLSNTSAASGDDVSAPSTPRSRKEAGPMPMTPSAHHPPFSQQQQQSQSQQTSQQHLLSHPPTPQSTVPSPGPASLPSQHEDYNDVHSPGPGTGNWNVSTRPTPSSPVLIFDGIRNKRIRKSGQLLLNWIISIFYLFMKQNK